MKALVRIVFFVAVMTSLPSALRAEHYYQLHIKIVPPQEVRLEGKLCAVKDLTDAIKAFRRDDAKLVVRIVVPMAPDRKFLKEVTDCCRRAGVTLTFVVQTS